MSNIKSHLRFLCKNKVYTAITITGFSISLCFVILLASYVRKELSVDSFHTNKETIYRVTNENYSSFSSPCGALFKETFPEIKEYCRIFEKEATFSDENSTYHTTTMYMVDKSFFQMFEFTLLKGDKESVLARKNSIVIEEGYSKELFGDKDPIGQVITTADKVDLTVTGVMEKFPENTIFYQRKIICDYESMRSFWGDEFMDEHDNNSANLYIQTLPEADIHSKSVEFYNLLKEVHWAYKNGLNKTVRFEPLQEVYFSELSNSLEKSNSWSFVLIMMTIALLILVLATINYTNLTISQSVLRDKDIAIRKLMGSSKRSMFAKLLQESIFICLVSSVLALFLSFVLESIFASILGSSIEFASNFTWVTAVLLFLFAILLGALSGLIPAFSMSRVTPIGIIKGEITRQNKKYYTKVLISLQYAASICLLICAGVITQQTSFLRNFELGFNKENLIQISNNAIQGNQKSLLKQKVLAIAGVKDYCNVSGSPLDGGNNNTMTIDDKNISFQVFLVDSTYFDFMGIQVTLTGAAYEKNAIFINEAAVAELGITDNPSSFKYNNKERTIRGVVRNFHYYNLTRKVGPAIVKIMDDDEWPWSMLVKLEPTAGPEVIAKIEEAYKEVSGGAPMDWVYADQEIRSWYDQEERIAKMISLFTFLTLLISVMGNYAMSLYYTKQRTKEVGVRRVNGASESEMLLMLNKGFLKWVLVAFVVACPISYFVMRNWLQGFAYHTSISWWIFLLAGGFMAFIALVSMSLQTIRTARANPVESLRDE